MSAALPHKHPIERDLPPAVCARERARRRAPLSRLPGRDPGHEPAQGASTRHQLPSRRHALSHDMPRLRQIDWIRAERHPQVLLAVAGPAPCSCFSDASTGFREGALRPGTATGLAAAVPGVLARSGGPCDTAQKTLTRSVPGAPVFEHGSVGFFKPGSNRAKTRPTDDPACRAIDDLVIEVRCRDGVSRCHRCQMSRQRVCLLAETPVQ